MTQTEGLCEQGKATGCVSLPVIGLHVSGEHQDLNRPGRLWGLYLYIIRAILSASINSEPAKDWVPSLLDTVEIKQENFFEWAIDVFIHWPV